MGNYVFDTKTLVDIVTPRRRARSDDLGGDVIPALTAAGVAHVYDFSTNVVPGQDERERGYWRDVGTLDAYFDANMDLVAPLPVFNLYNDRWPVYTSFTPLPPAKIARGPAFEPPFVDASRALPGLDHLGRAHRAHHPRARGVRRARQPHHRVDPVPWTCGSAPGRACTAASSTRTS